MTKIIDTNNETTPKLVQLKARGIETVIRYISTNTSGEKVVKPAEARAIAAAGLRLALVFEVWGGAENFAHDDIDAESGSKHGDFARQWAAGVGAPDNTIIWFAIDTDCSASQYEQRVKPYLGAAKVALRGQYRIGVYACGFVCGRALDENLVDATWLTQSMGFNGSRAFRDSRRWTLLQGPETTIEGLSIDSNDANSDDYGAFVPFEAPPSVAVATGPTVPQQDAPAFPQMGAPLPQIDLARIQRDIARLSQVAATFSQVASNIGQLPTAGLPPQVAQVEQTITRLGQITATLSQFASALSGQSPPAGAPELLTPIDKALGGQAMVGLKTPLAILAYAGMWIMQAVGAVGTATGPGATATGSVLTALIGGFGALGVTSKFGRAFLAIGLIASVLQKLPALPPMPPKAGGGA